MADDADIASETEQLRTDAALSGRERRTLPEAGHCYNCNETISAGLFCDADCRDDYEKRERLSAMRSRNSE
ncbi:hypothetical protein ABGY98_000489 [Salmonella enterica]|uniref:DUF2116 family Zn-ribbon domain-containing protein n=1 Tax=Salmonella enterica subsp. diarizonae serovar 48:i:z TaxID=1192842 RepID=A0A7U5YD26_SALDZ|nr:hypothetical protein [Salmonella enterica]EAA4450255.1 hypothetical protein [Salmonella enterica subsp. diarizonae]EDW6116423.1 hypothetical protein [Salmonella enterica subsp. salamae]AXC70703.1 hypothetical protein DOE59_03165 [Salmonella enterica subsp. diarizonae serovar 48:i:z]EAM2673044.1 hypothetical protein [Salmonella enterica]EAM6405347.1 hypothetical protein [Salmonella enterica]